MSRNVEKDIHRVKDSVRSGLINDDLSNLIDDVRNITSTHNPLDELSDDDLLKVAGGIHHNNLINNDIVDE